MLPLTGLVVVDCSRMLPGAVLARTLLDLGARVIKVEQPGSGDMMRGAPPLVGGVGAGFQAFFGGAESVTLDLRSESGAAAVRRLAKHADVFVESFRPGTLAHWGLSPESLRRLNASLVTCSLSGFGSDGPMAGRVGHDLNFVAASGLLSLLGEAHVPRAQLADVTTGLLASSAIMAALLGRHRTGNGMHVEQPLAAGPLPFLTWAWADAAAGGGGLNEHLLAGLAPCYGLYACADGRRLALGAIEPKFWAELVGELGLGELAGDGLDVGPAGTAAAARLAEAFAGEPAAHWLALAAARNWPLTAVADAHEAMDDPDYAARTALTPTADGEAVRSTGAYLPSFPPPAARPAPALGVDTARVLAEFGLASEPV